MPLIDIDQWRQVDVWEHEGKVHLAIDGTNGREMVSLTIEQARAIATALRNSAAEVGFVKSEQSR